MNSLVLLVAKERLRHTLRNIILCMVLVGFLAALALQPTHYAGWTQPIVIALLFGVPGGFVLWFVYRMMRFTFR